MGCKLGFFLFGWLDSWRAFKEKCSSEGKNLVTNTLKCLWHQLSSRATKLHVVPQSSYFLTPVSCQMRSSAKRGAAMASRYIWWTKKQKIKKDVGSKRMPGEEKRRSIGLGKVKSDKLAGQRPGGFKSF